MLLVEAASRVGEGAERQSVDDVLDATYSDRRLGGAPHCLVEQLQELTQRRLVHDVDDAHLHDHEVQHRAAGRHYISIVVQII